MKQCYFLDARDLPSAMLQEDVRKRALEKLDRDRLKRLSEGYGELTQSKRQGTAWAESLGAGLLLQYAVQEYLAGAGEEKMQVVTLSKVLEDERRVVPLSFHYGEKGKPYLEKIPLFFSISHSEGRVICAVSETEVGADLQYPRKMDAARLAARFFSEEEKREFSSLSLKEQEEFFYRLWVRKEAYGKLTGEGLAKVISQKRNVADDSDTLEWREFIHDGAYLAICYQRKQIQETNIK